MQNTSNCRQRTQANSETVEAIRVHSTEYAPRSRITCGNCESEAESMRGGTSVSAMDLPDMTYSGRNITDALLPVAAARRTLT
eukprot:gene14601-20650_t